MVLDPKSAPDRRTVFIDLEGVGPGSPPGSRAAPRHKAQGGSFGARSTHLPGPKPAPSAPSYCSAEQVL